jgi:UPF0716 protein FxsA
MGLVLLLAFIGVPIIEIAVLIQVGGWIGLWPTLGLIILTAVLGSIELRAQGLATVSKLRQQLDAGEMPAQTLFDGVCLLFAGALLLTPGFVTDVTGFLLLLPPFRRSLLQAVGPYIRRHAEARMYAAQHGGPGGPEGPFGGGPDGGGPRNGVIDADYQDVTERRPDGEGDGGEEPPRKLDR